MVELKTERLIFREYRDEDENRLSEIANNINIARNMINTFPNPYTVDDAKSFIDSLKNTDKIDKNFAIVLNGKIIGGIGFDIKTGIHEGVAKGGYWLGEEYWGNGYGTEAWSAIIDYVFEKFDIIKLEASVFSWNTASQRIQEKCGLKKEGVRRKSVVRFGEMCDEVLYGITRDEWMEVKHGKGSL